MNASATPRAASSLLLWRYSRGHTCGLALHRLHPPSQAPAPSPRRTYCAYCSALPSVQTDHSRIEQGLASGRFRTPASCPGPSTLYDVCHQLQLYRPLKPVSR
ncbi:hypothetical protein BD311DRAFT_142608 [Dichomitus squalens]|uniref:Uncharacterized protein n=1 Tax=Dichomitus squalens TaxID=114155 RepID=A0A4Q9M678_9APHY|nr:hypothetical protein BD311DRAFT_142608 [Dichomitus squalens]